VLREFGYTEPISDEMIGSWINYWRAEPAADRDRSDDSVATLNEGESNAGV